MHIAPLTPQQLNAATLNQVAALIYHTDIGLFRRLFGPPHQAIPHIARLITGTRNSFSHQFIHVATIDNNIAGIIIVLPPQHLHEDDFVTMLPWHALLRLAVTGIALAPLLRAKAHTMPYIQNICVAERFQGQGIGQQLITYATHDAHTHGHPSIALDVSLDNPRAQKLYERLGFVVTHTIRLWPWGSGVHRMHKSMMEHSN
jgi:ribosomal protein S18 acetylase RimI-like enzyme